jgi:hypothetical protein
LAGVPARSGSADAPGEMTTVRRKAPWLARTAAPPPSCGCPPPGARNPIPEPVHASGNGPSGVQRPEPGRRARRGKR